jgi:penicillin-insensitive murein DD-endopeptidase
MAAVAIAAFASGASGCAALGVINDGSSVSWGPPNRGGITNPAKLEDDGDGYRVPSRWSTRGLRYGTDEMVDFIVSVARRVQMDWPEARLTVGDISPASGGPSAWHRSHQNGRDVDLVFYMTDEAGRPVDPEIMRHFAADGRSTDDEGPPVLFDTARNWTLVRAFVEYQGTPIFKVFVYDPLKEMLLEHARAIGEPDWMIERASILLRQPGDSANHDDHFHVRLMCSPHDVPFGCEDYGTIELPTKKLAKIGMLTWVTWAVPMRQTMAAPLPAMFSLAGFP